jgi:hypothetical protein
MKTSNKILLGLLVLILLTITTVMVFIKAEFHKFSSTNYRGNGKQYSTTLNLAKFNQIEVEDLIKVNYTQDTFQSVIIRADSNLLKSIVAEDKNGKLRLYLRDKIELDDPILVDITTDSINAVKLSTGGCFSTTHKMMVSNFHGEGTAGAVFSMDGDFNDIDMDMNNGCVVNFSGKCKNLNLAGSSGSVLTASNMIAANCSIKAYAGAIMNVNVTDEISVDASAGSIVNCNGKAKTKNMNISSGAQFSN